MNAKPALSVAATTIVLFLLWICLTLSLDVQELILGFSVSVIVAFATGGHFTGNVLGLLNPRRIVRIIEYALFFLKKMVMANIDVFLRVIRPSIPVRPGIVKAEIKLRNTRARTIVANSITLTPGTLTVDMIEDSIFVHWISLPEGDVESETQKMVDGFAERLGRIFD
jgi:multicomponent Na+:H+ antiporter subunit E